MHDKLVEGIRAALRGNEAGFWDGSPVFAGKPAEFTDAIHINWVAAQRYSALLATALDADHALP